MPYTKLGPFTDGSATPPINAAFLNGIETALVAATAPDAVTAPAPSGSDDTTALNNWLNTLGSTPGKLYPGGSYKITGIFIPANVTLTGYGAVLNGLAATAANVSLVTVSDRVRVAGLEINGSAVTAANVSGINSVQNVTKVVITDCRISNLTNTGISLDHATDCRISGNWIGQCSSNGIGVTFSAGIIIEANTMRTNGGIEVWGGDSASLLGSSFGTTNIVVANNSVKGIGGIFFSAVQHFTITGNTVDGAQDVGIDLEGCADGTITGNDSKDCVNACYSIFFGGRDMVFSGNRANNSLSSGIGAAMKIFGSSVTCTGIAIVGNEFLSVIAGFITDTGALNDSVISGNGIRCTNGGIPILLAGSVSVAVTGNRIATTGARGISLDNGAGSCLVSQNQVIQLGTYSTALGQDGGIYLTSPGVGNIVRGNKIVQFSTGIADRGNANVIEDNTVDTIWHNQSGGGYTTFINGNRQNANPLNAAAVTAVP